VRPVRVAGRSLRLPGAGARARGLARAAVSLDAAAVRELLDDSLASDGVIDTWDLVVRPVLGAIGNCWGDTGTAVEIEHLLTDGVLGAMWAARRGAASSGSGRPVLLACVPDELHSLPLYPLSATLAARGVPCRVLGAALPADALMAAIRRTAPSVVFLWAQLTRYAAPDLLAGLPQLRPKVRVFAGGPGWTGSDLPAATELLDSLTAATECISAAGGNDSRRRVINAVYSTSDN
jgi:methanogenic corrinoid protein MtbC1